MAEELRLAEVLVRLSHLVDRVFGDAARHYGLTPQQVHLLCILTERPTGMTELGRLLDLGKSGLTGLVDRVERRGLTTRTRDTCDRRAWKVTLTDEGTRLAVEAHELIVARLDALGGLPPRERTEAAACLARLLGEQGKETEPTGSASPAASTAAVPAP